MLTNLLLIFSLLYIISINLIFNGFVVVHQVAVYYFTIPLFYETGNKYIVYLPLILTAFFFLLVSSEDWVIVNIFMAVEWVVGLMGKITWGLMLG